MSEIFLSETKVTEFDGVLKLFFPQARRATRAHPLSNFGHRPKSTSHSYVKFKESAVGSVAAFSVKLTTTT